jgi:hypothetical protein
VPLRPTSWSAIIEDLGVKKKITHEDFLLALEMEREEREEDI